MLCLGVALINACMCGCRHARMYAGMNASGEFGRVCVCVCVSVSTTDFRFNETNGKNYAKNVF